MNEYEVVGMGFNELQSLHRQQSWVLYVAWRTPDPVGAVMGKYDVHHKSQQLSVMKRAKRAAKCQEYHHFRIIIIIIIEGLSLLQSIPPTTADKQTQAQKRRGSRSF